MSRKPDTAKTEVNGAGVDPRRRDLKALQADLKRVIDETIAVFKQGELRRRYNRVSEDEYFDCLVVALEEVTAEAEDRLYELVEIEREREVEDEGT